MSNDINLNFIKKLQAGVEPTIQPGETALEAIQRTEAEKTRQLSDRFRVQPAKPSADSQSSSQQQPTLEVVFIDGYRLPRNFFTCLALCIMKLDNPEINEIFEKFGFEMRDLDGKPVVLKKSRKSKKK